MSRAAPRCLLIAALLVAPAGPGPQAGGSPAASAAADAAFLDTLTWGATPASFARLQAEGRARWLHGQLHPHAETRLSPDAQAAVDALTPPGSLFERAQALDAQARAFKDIPDPEAKKAGQQAFQAALNMAARNAASSWVLRALYSPDQLRERLTWFWFNRFNVHQGKATLRAAVGDYLDTAIRPHALGRFRDLLMASLRHPAMLRYLDNADNAAGRINENYAREIMELHTMGVGSGYSQADVEALARILTGVGIDLKPEDPKLRPEHAADFRRDGLFEFNPNRHDYGDKVFLGTRIQGRGWAEVEEAVDLIARHPATAMNVSRALATYILGQAPDDALAARLATTFTRTDGDVAAIVEALVREPAFAADRGGTFKDPVRYVFSAVRMAYDERVILNAGPVLGWLNRLGEGLFNRSTPDGYPLDAAAWSGPGQLATRFEIARQIGSGSAGLFKPPTPDQPEQPAFPVVANGLYFAARSESLSASTRAALAQAVSPQDWNTLYLASPEFMR
ncbi:DUF1800 domain-containing protein [Methylobacterium sp. PvR107]|uniref:DUF1800 domain-containing protein n=1 Tax=Methylobacterium sp. PvR107 TaxID=2806597 RepID=UPI001AE4A180|nr:DUF1800 domain-containing protein [Methylobacterium sp. PvR107]MBP1180115.1 uncharacterized protein (DUF1800 family) [Methylobacterium sp. PvR107]